MSKIDDKLNEVLGIAEEPNELEVIQKEIYLLYQKMFLMMIVIQAR